MPTQQTAPFYLLFGFVLAALFFAALAYAYLIVRKAAENKVEGQTASFVVLGVGSTVLASVFLIGLVNAAIVLACFVASGLPMIIEYSSRVHSAQRKDQQNAEKVAKDLLK